MVILSKILSCIPKISPLRLKQLLDDLGVYTQTGDTQVGYGVACVLWVEAYLSALSPLSAEQVKFIVDSYLTELDSHGKEIAHRVKKKSETLPVFLLAIHDRRYAHISGTEPVLNLVTGEMMTDYPKTSPKEMICYDITRIFTSSYMLINAKSHA